MAAVPGDSIEMVFITAIRASGASEYYSLDDTSTCARRAQCVA
jgi:hypothetical protein